LRPIDCRWDYGAGDLLCQGRAFVGAIIVDDESTGVASSNALFDGLAKVPVPDARCQDKHVAVVKVADFVHSWLRIRDVKHGVQPCDVLSSR
jgi:hypothetical protein